MFKRTYTRSQYEDLKKQRRLDGAELVGSGEFQEHVAGPGGVAKVYAGEKVVIDRHGRAWFIK